MRKKRIKTIVCVAAIATMLLSSMGIGVFAEVEQNAPSSQAQEETTVGTGGSDVVGIPQVDPTEPTAPASEMKTESQNNVTAKEEGDDPDPKPVYTQGITTIYTLSGHQRIKLVWNPAVAEITPASGGDEPEEPTTDSNASESHSTDPTTTTEPTPEPKPISQYIVQRAPQGGALTDYCTINLNEDGTVSSLSGYAVDGSYKASPYWTKLPATAVYSNGLYSFEDKDVGDGIMDNATKQFRGGAWIYRVIPVIDGERGTNAQSGVTAPDSCVRTSAVALKIKVKKNLKSHDKQHKKLSLKKGTTIYTSAFGYGRYQFIHDGNLYWLNRVGTKSHKTVYDNGHPYSDEEVLYYINGRDGNDGIELTSSSTNKLIWVNTYTQRIYVFQGSAGNWGLVAGNDAAWKVSTGKPATPTIRYIDPKDPVIDTGRIVGKCKTIDKKVKKRHGIPSWNCFSTWNAIHGQKKSWSIKGVPKSNGCVRNTNAHANWIYNNCPKKTRVLIF